MRDNLALSLRPDGAWELRLDGWSLRVPQGRLEDIARRIFTERATGVPVEIGRSSAPIQHIVDQWLREDRERKREIPELVL